MAKNDITLLVVDDNIEQVNILEKIFTKEGYAVRVASSGFDALKIVESEDVNIVITDMSMPGMSGLKLLKQIKDKKPGVEVIIITAFGEWGSYAEALKEGAYEFLNKPFKVDDIMNLVRGIENKVRSKNKV
ncbi:MAG TPA: response regulator [bacterium]|nr:response regulator [bacterium]